MDPNETLKRLRAIVRDIQADRDDPAGYNATTTREDEAADLVQALDAWLCSGGFLPDAWRTKRRLHVK